MVGEEFDPVVELRFASLRYVTDINRVPSLEFIHESGNNAVIGALITRRDIEVSMFIRKRTSLMSETASCIGDPR